jgi:hypothetical protein
MSLNLKSTARGAALGFGIAALTLSGVANGQVLQTAGTAPISSPVKVDPVTCATIGKMFTLQITKHGDDLSLPFAEAFNSYFESGCVGVVNGKPLVIPITTIQDDISARILLDWGDAGKTPVDLKATGLTFDYTNYDKTYRPRAATGAPTRPAAKGKSSSLAGPELAKK